MQNVDARVHDSVEAIRDALVRQLYLPVQWTGCVQALAGKGVARMADPEIIVKIMEAVSIPVMAKCRIGHFAEARVLESLGVDFIDESEVLTPADDAFHVDKLAFKVPFV